MRKSRAEILREAIKNLKKENQTLNIVVSYKDRCIKNLKEKLNGERKLKLKKLWRELINKIKNGLRNLLPKRH